MSHLARDLVRTDHPADQTQRGDQQDKRSVVSIKPEDVETWLHAPVEQALRLVRLAPVERFSAGTA